MNFESRWFANFVEKAKRLCASNTGDRSLDISTEETEALRRWSWDKKYIDGRIAPAAEWEQEYARRHRYEKVAAAGVGPGVKVRLIKEFLLDYADHTVMEQPVRLTNDARMLAEC